MQMDQTDNQAILRGTVLNTPVFSHSVHGIDFLQFQLCVPRLSGREDILNVLAAASLLERCPATPGTCVEISGEVRSFNNRSGVGHRLIITLYAQSMRSTQEDACNELHLQGVICKSPILRRTPLGRDICDFLLAVNRRYHRADYLPCISWGSLATLCSKLKVGDTVSLEGRLQSRVYLKSTETESEEHTAFEISVMSLDFAE